MQTLGALRAIVWLRWRLLKNSVAGARKRDALEQMSRALALIVPVLIASLSIGTFIAISIVGFMGGRAVAGGQLDTGVGIFILRIMLGIMTFTVIALALASPTQSSMSRYNRLLILPIHRRVLHLVEVASSLADPWLAVIAAGLVSFSLGLLAGGRPMAALIALVAAVASVAVLVCAGSLAGFLVSWLMKSRRRGELFTLIFVMGFTLVSFLPAFASRSLDDRPANETQEERRARREQRREFNVQDFDRRLPVWARYIPSELHGRTTSAGLAGDHGQAAAGVAILFLEAAGLFLISSRVHSRMLNSLESDSGRRRSRQARGPSMKLPFLSAGASAVGWAQFRGALRTVRGRLTILLPGPMLGMLVVAFQRVPQETWATNAAQQGFLLLAAAIVFTLYSMHAVSMNFFGSDRAGFTRQLLAPLTDREIAWGKIAGFAMVTGTGMIICLASALAVARSGAPSYWIATLIGGASVFMLISPIAIWFSALFPVASDLSKTGSGGNPHPFPMIAGTLCTAAFAVPPALIVLLAEYRLHNEIAAVIMMLVWFAISAAVAIPLVNLSARAIGMRRENLALVAQGK